MNRNQRRMAAYNAMKSTQAIELGNHIRKIDAAFSRLSGEPERVMKAISTTEYKMKPRSKPEQYTGSVCLPEVARYAAGHRAGRKDAVHIFK